MGWPDIKFNERLGLIALIVQASATVGMLIVAVVGISQVAPIITYQTYQIEQKKEEEAEKKAQKEEATLETKLPKHSVVVDRFVNDVFGWWTNQVESYQKIMDAIKDKDNKVTFKVVGGKPDSSDVMSSPDFLIVTAISASGKKQVIKVAVNERAMNPNQYIQCKINQGLLYDMAAPDREKAELAISRYINEGMVNKVPPAYVQSDMTLKQIYEAISYHQAQRVEAIAQIRAMHGVIEAALD
jgi:hypothetical protein